MVDEEVSGVCKVQCFRGRYKHRRIQTRQAAGVMRAHGGERGALEGVILGPKLGSAGLPWQSSGFKTTLPMQ